MKITNIVLKVLLSLLLVMPILGTLGVFPPPTPDMYNTKEAFAFIDILMTSKYITVIQSIVFLLALVCLWTSRVALSALLLLPISINIVGFHMFLDGGLFTFGALMGNVFFLLNLYFLYKSKDQLKFLIQKA